MKGGKIEKIENLGLVHAYLRTWAMTKWYCWGMYEENEPCLMLGKINF